jgi:hypothetical protein
VLRRASGRARASDSLQQPKELVGGKILEEVPLGTALDRLEQVGILFRCGQDDDLDVRLLGTDEPSGGQAVKLGHVQIHEHNVGAEPPRLVDSLAAITGFADHLDPARLEQTAQSVAEQSMIVSYQNAHRPG